MFVRKVKQCLYLLVAILGVLVNMENLTNTGVQTLQRPSRRQACVLYAIANKTI